MFKQIASPDSPLQQLSTLGFIIYPVVAHVAILIGQQIWATYYLLGVVSFTVVMLLFRLGVFLRIGGLVLYLILLFIGYSLGFSTKLMFLPPIVIPAWLAILFISSLRPTRVAVISRIAARMEGTPLDSHRAHYTRWLTAVWGGVFILMVAEALFLAVLAPFEIWSWWVHVGNYLVVVILFASDLITRRIIFGGRIQIIGLVRELTKRRWHERNENG